MSSVTIIHANSPRYNKNLLVSHMGHQISRIKLSYKLFCTLIWNVFHFSQNSNFLWFKGGFLGYFACTSSLIVEGVMQKKESPDFRILKVVISGLSTSVNNCKHSHCCSSLNNKYFSPIPAFTCYFHYSITSCHFIHS